MCPALTLGAVELAAQREFGGVAAVALGGLGPQIFVEFVRFAAVPVLALADQDRAAIAVVVERLARPHTLGGDGRRLLGLEHRAARGEHHAPRAVLRTREHPGPADLLAVALGGVDDRFTPGRISVARQARPELPGDRDGGPRLTAGHLVECADRDGAAGALGVLLLDVGQDRLDGLGAVGP